MVHRVWRTSHVKGAGHGTYSSSPEYMPIATFEGLPSLSLLNSSVLMLSKHLRWGLGFGFGGLEFVVWGLGCGVLGLGLEIWNWGLEIWD